MFNDKKILGLIPARGGSKGLPGKNIRELAGKPLIAWAIEASLQSRYIDKTVVTTDSEEIAAVSRKYGANVPFLRPAELADDTSHPADAVYHALENLNEDYEITVLLQPTSPLRTVKDVDGAIEYFFDKAAKSVISVCECDHSPIWTGTLREDMNMKDFIKPEYKNIPRQQLPAHYKLNGALYMIYNDYLRQHNSFLTEETFAYVMNRENSVDIDSIIDFKLAEVFIPLQQSK